ncbi:MAG: tripartite tricarboxylate transporter substrate-binding protein [Rubrivivax sp.]
MKAHQPHSRSRRVFLVSITALALASSAQAQPTGKSITLVVPFAPGGPVDTLARALAEKLRKPDRVVLVENRVGAGSLVAAETVARAPANGLTLLVATQATLVANPVLYKTLPYDPVRSFQPIALLSETPAVLVVPASSGIASWTDLLAAMRRSPQPYAYASAGNGTLHHVAGEVLRASQNLQLVHVPYRGSGPALTDVLGGRVPMMFVDLSTAGPHIKAGTLRPLLVTGHRRLQALPAVPTAAESGMPDLTLTSWQVLVAPAGVSDAMIDALQRDVQSAMQALAADERYAAAGFELHADMGLTRTAEFIARERAVWTQAIKRSGATAD